MRRDETLNDVTSKALGAWGSGTIVAASMVEHLGLGKMIQQIDTMPQCFDIDRLNRLPQPQAPARECCNAF